MDLLRLRLSMIGTLTAIIGLTTLFISVVLYLVGSLSLTTLLISVVAFNLLQWMIAPYMVDSAYRVRPLSQDESPELHRMLADLSARSGVKTPRLMIADIPIPNAFAYGSPIAGTRIAVTTGLVKTLKSSQIEAVVGHEIGHLKHKDAQVMMLVSVLPAICYMIANSFMWSSYGDRNRRSDLGIVAGSLGMILYLILTLFVLNLSRLREYYADRHSTSVVKGGARSLSEGLALITAAMGRMSHYRGQSYVSGLSNFKALFISDPDTARADSASLHLRGGFEQESLLVEQLRSREVSLGERFGELFSTHPNIVKRLQALRQLE